jgi:hypothetical protein
MFELRLHGGFGSYGAYESLPSCMLNNTEQRTKIDDAGEEYTVERQNFSCYGKLTTEYEECYTWFWDQMNLFTDNRFMNINTKKNIILKIGDLEIPILSLKFDKHILSKSTVEYNGRFEVGNWTNNSW